MNDEVERMWNEAVAAKFLLLSLHLPLVAEKNVSQDSLIRTCDRLNSFHGNYIQYRKVINKAK
jgi:hypothetical protein